MYLQDVDTSSTWSGRHGVTYGDMYQRDEGEWSTLQLRGRRRRHAVAALRRLRGRVRRAASMPDLVAARIRLRAQVQPRLQPARRARRDQRDRARRATSSAYAISRALRPCLPRAGEPGRGDRGCLTPCSRSAARSCPPARAARSWSRRRPARRGAGRGRACERLGARVSVAPRRFAVAARACRASSRATRRTDRGPPPPRPSAPTAPPRRRPRASPAQGRRRLRTSWCTRRRPRIRVRRAPQRGPSRRRRWCPAWPSHVSAASASPRRCAGARARACASRRPVRWIVAKLDGAVAVRGARITAGDVTRGHRFLGGPATVAARRWVRGGARGGLRSSRATRPAARRIVAGLDALAAEAAGGRVERPGRASSRRSCSS